MKKGYIAGKLFKQGDIRQRLYEEEILKKEISNVKWHNPINDPEANDKSKAPTAETIFKNDCKKFKKAPKNGQDIELCLELLIKGGADNLPLKMKAHKLIGDYKDYWECHINSDLLLIWFQFDEDKKEIHLTRIGSHSDLFK